MAEQILQKIKESMRCSNCDKYLRPPILYCTDKSNICGDCERDVSPSCIVGINTKLEYIGSLLKFPCRYEEFGCRVSISWEDAITHENNCLYRQFSCPICSNWKGTAAGMKSHVNTSHTNMIFRKSITLVLQEGKTKRFFIHSQKLYVLVCHCDLDIGLLWFTMKFVGPLEYAAKRFFKITITLQEGVEYSERSYTDTGANWEIEEKDAVKIDIPVLKAKLRLKNENVVKLAVDIFSRVPLYNGNLDIDLQREIECPICKEYMGVRIYQCYTGHSFCAYCSLKLQACPTCAGEMTATRNFALESICSKMYYKCMYSDKGCTFASLPLDIINHESVCQFGCYDCPFKSFIQDCKWRGRLDEIRLHTLEEHGIKM